MVKIVMKDKLIDEIRLSVSILKISTKTELDYVVVNKNDVERMIREGAPSNLVMNEEGGTLTDFEYDGIKFKYVEQESLLEKLNDYYISYSKEITNGY